MASTPEEERAAALSEYLAKAHEEKLRAVREVEEKKSEEIQALKQQVEELKSSGASGGALTTAAAPAARHVGAGRADARPKYLRAHDGAKLACEAAQTERGHQLG